MMGTAVSFWVAENFSWAFLAILVLNILQKRHQPRAGRKRFATLYIAIGALLFMVAGQIIVTFGGNDLILLAALCIILAVMIHFRTHTFPFYLYSRRDGRKLTWEEVLYVDEELTPEQDKNDPEETDSIDGGK